MAIAASLPVKRTGLERNIVDVLCFDFCILHVHSADTQAEPTAKKRMQRVASETLLEAEAGKEAATIPIEEQPHNTLNLVHDVTPSADCFRKTVKGPTLKRPEHL